MSLRKIFEAFKNINQIKEGIVNNYLRKKDIEMIAKARMHICKSCKFIDTHGSKCMVPKTGPCCSQCGCSLKLKTRSLSSSCPKNYWLAIMSEEEEMNLK